MSSPRCRCVSGCARCPSACAGTWSGSRRRSAPCCASSCASSRRICARPAEPTDQDHLAGVYSDRGVAHYDLGNMPAAIADYGRAIDILAPVVEHLGDQAQPAMRNHLAAIHQNRGNARTALSDPSELIAALADHNSAIRIRDDLKAALGDDMPPSMEKDHAQVYMNRGEAAQGASRRPLGCRSAAERSADGRATARARLPPADPRPGTSSEPPARR